MLKVIFLDIDGVLNTSETFVRRYLAGRKNIEIDNERVGYLKEIVDRTNSKIVLSSSWRHYFIKKDNRVVPVHEKGIELTKIFNDYGLKLYDVTPYSSSGMRQEEIMEWLNNHEVESFVVIDDDSYDLQMFLNKELIKTSFTKDNEMVTNMDECCGLCKKHIDRAVSILNKENKKILKR